MILDTTREFLVTYANYFGELIEIYLPNIIGSVVIVLLGWFFAFVIRLVILRVFRGLDRVVEYKHGTPRKHTASRVAADVIFWLLIIFALILAAQNLGFSLLVQVLNYLPNVIVATIIFFIGYVLSNLFYNILQNSLSHLEKKRAHALAHLVKWLTIVFFIVLAVDQLQINITLLSAFTVIGFAGAVLCVSISFALSFIEILKNTLACQQVQKQLEIGRSIMLDDTEGRVIDFTQTHVLIETDEGISHIPAHLFQQKVVKLLTAFK